MTAKDVLSYLHESRVTEPIEIFLYLANHAHELRLSHGRRLIDGGDFKEFLLDLAEAITRADKLKYVQAAVASAQAALAEARAHGQDTTALQRQVTELQQSMIEAMQEFIGKFREN